jgi:hypothetical protein
MIACFVVEAYIEGITAELKALNGCPRGNAAVNKMKSGTCCFTHLRTASRSSIDPLYDSTLSLKLREEMSESMVENEASMPPARAPLIDFRRVPHKHDNLHSQGDGMWRDLHTHVSNARKNLRCGQFGSAAYMGSCGACAPEQKQCLAGHPLYCGWI